MILQTSVLPGCAALWAKLRLPQTPGGTQLASIYLGHEPEVPGGHGCTTWFCV